MDSLFGRRKTKGRQSSISDLNEVSVPYDRLAPAPKSPLPAGARGTGFISAPITNPTLTTTGTELNKYAIERSRNDRARAYEQHLPRSGSPSTISTVDSSSTLYSDSNNSYTTTKLQKTARQTRRSELSSPSVPPSPGMSDFGHLSTGAMGFFPATIPASSMRPVSSATHKSESNRGSKYAPSLTSSEGGSHHSHLSHFYHPHRSHGGPDVFDFPRPETDEEIDALFEKVRQTRDIGDLPSQLSTEQKWHMVYNDWQIRWREEKEQSRRQVEHGQSGAIVKESPEWYIRKFLDKTINAKQAGSLLVSIRSKELSWFQQFLRLHGTSVLAQCLIQISRKGGSR